MTVTRAMIAILSFAMVFAAGGALIGMGVGALVPDYYRNLFRHGHEPHFDPVMVGTGLGLTQGALIGTAAGVIVVVALVWQHVRTAAKL